MSYTAGDPPYFYTCSVCGGRFSGVHYCTGAPYQTVTLPLQPFTYSAPLIDEETKQLMRRLIEVLERLEKQ